jgi:hypothetical protein
MTFFTKIRRFVPVPHGPELPVTRTIKAFHQGRFKNISKIQFFRKRLGAARCHKPIPTYIKMVPGQMTFFKFIFGFNVPD